MDYLLTWRFALSLGIFVGLAAYSSWLYSLVLRDRHRDRLHFAQVVGELRADIQYLADYLGVDLAWEEPNPVEPPEADTAELPVVKGDTVEMEAVRPTPYKREPEPERTDTAETATVVVRSLAEILAEAGHEPLKRRRL